MYLLPFASSFLGFGGLTAVFLKNITIKLFRDRQPEDYFHFVCCILSALYCFNRQNNYHLIIDHSTVRRPKLA